MCISFQLRNWLSANFYVLSQEVCENGAHCSDIPPALLEPGGKAIPYIKRQVLVSFLHITFEEALLPFKKLSGISDSWAWCPETCSLFPQQLH